MRMSKLFIPGSFERERNRRRAARINEALGWPTGTRQNPTTNEIWSDGVYWVGFWKPGKEVDRKGEDQNLNDMKPVVVSLSDNRRPKDATFRDLFKALGHCTKMKRKKLGRILGVLLTRSAMMCDHEKNKDGNWRYVPNPKMVEKLTQELSILHEVPVVAFLHYLDAIGWNEDIKYNKPRAGELRVTLRGRPNNMMTLVNVVAAEMELVTFEDVMGDLIAKTGIAPLTMTDARKYFPVIGTEVEVAKARQAHKKRRAAAKKKLRTSRASD
jgi:hypothetical protein